MEEVNHDNGKRTPRKRYKKLSKAVSMGILDARINRKYETEPSPRAKVSAATLLGRLSPRKFFGTKKSMPIVPVRRTVSSVTYSSSTEDSYIKGLCSVPIDRTRRHYDRKVSIQSSPLRHPKEYDFTSCDSWKFSKEVETRFKKYETSGYDIEDSISLCSMDHVFPKGYLPSVRIDIKEAISICNVKVVQEGIKLDKVTNCNIISDEADIESATSSIIFGDRMTIKRAKDCVLIGDECTYVAINCVIIGKETVLFTGSKNNRGQRGNIIAGTGMVS